MSIIKDKLVNKQELTSAEVEELIWDAPKDVEKVETQEGDDRRWYRTNSVVFVVKPENRYFMVDYEQGLTEDQENVYDSQVAVEVVRKEKVITTTYWEVI